MVSLFSLLVIRVADIQRSVQFYSVLGLEFIREQHGGPEHYSTLLGEVVFELYPASQKSPVSASTRLGFSVDSVQRVTELFRELGAVIQEEPTASLWGMKLVVVDPDGHCVELSERSPSEVVE